MRRAVLALGLILAVAPALAQAPPAQPPGIDARLAQPTIAALQALLALREAELRALTDDAKKRDAEWAEYSAPLWRSEQQPDTGR